MRFRAVLEKRTTERAVLEIEARTMEEAAGKAKRACTVAKVRGVTITTPYDAGVRDSAETVVEVRAYAWNGRR